MLCFTLSFINQSLGIKLVFEIEAVSGVDLWEVVIDCSVVGNIGALVQVIGNVV